MFLPHAGPRNPGVAAQLLQAGITVPPAVRFVPNGCDDCDLTGYKGRIGIYEMLILDDSVRSAIHDTGRTDAVRSLARANGMKFMYEHALQYVEQGVSSIEEVQRVVPLEQTAALNCPACRREISPAFLFCPFCGERQISSGSPHFQPQTVVDQGVLMK